MNYALSAMWLLLAAGWFSGIAMIAKLIGGYQWIAHMGQTRIVGMLIAAGTVCAVAGLLAALNRRASTGVVSVASVIAGVHLINAIGVYVLFSNNGRVGPAFVPFALFSQAIPTSTQFMGMPPGNASLFILPVGTLVVSAVALLSRGGGRRGRSEA